MKQELFCKTGLVKFLSPSICHFSTLLLHLLSLLSVLSVFYDATRDADKLNFITENQEWYEKFIFTTMDWKHNFMLTVSSP